MRDARDARLASDPVGRCLVCRGVLRDAQHLRAHGGDGFGLSVVPVVFCRGGPHAPVQDDSGAPMRPPLDF